MKTVEEVLDEYYSAIAITDLELRELESETWQALKMDPNAAVKFLIEAGWISKRFGVGV